MCGSRTPAARAALVLVAVRFASAAVRKDGLKHRIIVIIITKIYLGVLPVLEE